MLYNNDVEQQAWHQPICFQVQVWTCSLGVSELGIGWGLQLQVLAWTDTCPNPSQCPIGPLPGVLLTSCWVRVFQVL
jgi:hypothetical protein